MRALNVAIDSLIFVELHHDTVDTVAVVVVDIVAEFVDKQEGEVVALRQSGGVEGDVTDGIGRLAARLDEDLDAARLPVIIVHYLHHSDIEVMLVLMAVIHLSTHNDVHDILYTDGHSGTQHLGHLADLEELEDVEEGSIGVGLVVGDGEIDTRDIDAFGDKGETIEQTVMARDEPGRQQAACQSDDDANGEEPPELTGETVLHDPQGEQDEDRFGEDDA